MKSSLAMYNEPLNSEPSTIYLLAFGSLLFFNGPIADGEDGLDPILVIVVPFQLYLFELDHAATRSYEC